MGSVPIANQVFIFLRVIRIGRLFHLQHPARKIYFYLLHLLLDAASPYGTDSAITYFFVHFKQVGDDDIRFFPCCLFSESRFETFCVENVDSGSLKQTSPWSKHFCQMNVFCIYSKARWSLTFLSPRGAQLWCPGRSRYDLAKGRLQCAIRPRCAGIGRGQGRNQLIFSGGGKNDWNLMYLISKHVFETFGGMGKFLVTHPLVVGLGHYAFN